MQDTKRIVNGLSGGFAALLAIYMFAGCQCCKEEGEQKAASATPAAAAATAPAAAPIAAPPVTPPVAPVAAPTVAPAAVAAAVAVAEPAASVPAQPIRIRAGASTSFTDAEGNTWLAEQGFADGDTAERPDLQIANTKTPAIYLSERYNMASFSQPVPNGKYAVKLHFAETYEGITAAGERVFTFNVEGKEFKDFDVFVKAGGPLRAYIETVNVEVTDGKLDITFTPQVEYPEINGIEILPAP